MDEMGKEETGSIKRILNKKKQYLDLLMLADPSEEMINKYLDIGDLFLLSVKDTPVCAAVVTAISEDECELKCLATYPAFQGKGYGKQMVKYLQESCKPRYKQMMVGTGNSSVGNIDFYKKCGFTYSHTIRNFFKDNYNEPIFENGIQCIDMICLKTSL